MNRKHNDDRAWMEKALDKEERVEHGLPAKPAEDDDGDTTGSKSEPKHDQTDGS